MNTKDDALQDVLRRDAMAAEIRRRMRAGVGPGFAEGEDDDKEEMEAQLWAAGLPRECAAFVCQQLWQKGYRLTKTRSR